VVGVRILVPRGLPEYQEVLELVVIHLRLDSWHLEAEAEAGPLVALVALEDLGVVEVPITVLLELEILLQVYQDRGIRGRMEVYLDKTHPVEVVVPEV